MNLFAIHTSDSGGKSSVHSRKMKMVHVKGADLSNHDVNSYDHQPYCPVSVIERKHGWISFGFSEIWRFRELLYYLAWRDVKVRYKQSLLGASWVIIKPVVSMLIFSIIFGKLAKFPSDGVPYPVFVYAGLLVWNLFSSSILQASGSIVSQVNLIKKIYFPRIIMPISAILVNLVDFVVASIGLFGAMIYYGIFPTCGIILIPLLILLVLMTSLGIGMILASLQVKYRDVGYVVGFILQIWMYITPVIYPVSFLTKQYWWLFYLNPVAGCVETMRAVLFGLRPVPWSGLLLSVCVGFVFLVCGAVYFRKTEQVFADII